MTLWSVEIAGGGKYREVEVEMNPAFLAFSCLRVNIFICWDILVFCTLKFFLCQHRKDVCFNVFWAYPIFNNPMIDGLCVNYLCAYLHVNHIYISRFTCVCWHVYMFLRGSHITDGKFLPNVRVYPFAFTCFHIYMLACLIVQTAGGDYQPPHRNPILSAQNLIGGRDSEPQSGWSVVPAPHLHIAPPLYCSSGSPGVNKPNFNTNEFGLFVWRLVLIGWWVLTCQGQCPWGQTGRVALGSLPQGNFTVETKTMLASSGRQLCDHDDVTQWESNRQAHSFVRHHEVWTPWCRNRWMSVRKPRTAGDKLPGRQWDTLKFLEQTGFARHTPTLTAVKWFSWWSNLVP